MIDYDCALDILDSFRKAVVFASRLFSSQAAALSIAKEKNARLVLPRHIIPSIDTYLAEQIAEHYYKGREIVLVGFPLSGGAFRRIGNYLKSAEDNLSLLVITPYISLRTFVGEHVPVYISHKETLVGESQKLSNTFGCAHFAAKYMEECGAKELPEVLLMGMVEENLHNIPNVRDYVELVEGEEELCILRDFPLKLGLYQSLPIAFNSTELDELGRIEETLEEMGFDPMEEYKGNSGLEEMVIDGLKAREEFVKLPTSLYERVSFYKECTLERSIGLELETKHLEAAPDIAEHKANIFRKLYILTERCEKSLEATPSPSEEVERGVRLFRMRDKSFWKDVGYYLTSKGGITIFSAKDNDFHRIMVKPESDERAWAIPLLLAFVEGGAILKKASTGAIPCHGSATRAWIRGDVDMVKGSRNFYRLYFLEPLKELKPIVRSWRDGTLNCKVEFPPLLKFKYIIDLLLKELEDRVSQRIVHNFSARIQTDEEGLKKIREFLARVN